MASPLTKMVDFMPGLTNVLPLPSLALATVLSKNGASVYASSDTLFKGAVFGRDSLEVAEDLLFIKPALVRNILLTLGRLQGLETNPHNEEQPGKIIHEYRQTTLDGKPIDATSRQIFQELARKWGGTQDELAYYGSIDATPHFLRTLGSYCRSYGKGILQETVVQRDGNEVTMSQVVRAAVAWLQQELAGSRSGLLEYQKVNPQGISNQVWKDSEEFYVHENGEMANHLAPIASIEVQGIVYDALMAAGQLLPRKKAAYTALACQVRDKTIEYLWQPERAYFALGLDYDPQTSQQRLITTPTANPAALLDTDIFADLPKKERQTYVGAIIERIMAPDFLTNAGVRSRSLIMENLVSFWDYHGSFVTWPKETYDIAKGLRRQGFAKLGRQLENRLVNLVLKTRDYPEFVYVDAGGRVLTGAPGSHPHGGLVFVEGKSKPERLQAWTVSALMAIITSRGQARIRGKSSTPPPREAWQKILQEATLARIPHVEVHVNPLKLWLQYPTHKYYLSGHKKPASA